MKRATARRQENWRCGADGSLSWVRLEGVLKPNDFKSDGLTNLFFFQFAKLFKIRRAFKSEGGLKFDGILKSDVLFKFARIFKSDGLRIRMAF